jgi:UDP-N-acetylmuramoylalanine--D-glutamate ligase
MNSIKDKKVLVWGLGKTGLALKSLLEKLGAKVLTIGTEPHCDFQDANLIESDFELIFKSPGVPWSAFGTHFAPEMDLEYKGIPITCDVEFVGSMVDVPIIAVTGSNGKSSVCKMIADFLGQMGKKVFLGANFGTPCSDMVLSEDTYEIAVWELSSFQLEMLQDFRAQIGILTNLSQTHMERYQKVEDYYYIKRTLAKRSDTFFEFEQKDFSVFQKNFDFSKSLLVGIHNQYNFYFCYKACQKFGMKVESEFQEFINTFKGLEHRIEYVGAFGDTSFYNDSKSTNLHSTLKALSAFDEKKVTLIIGGKLRESDLSSFSEITEYGCVQKIIVIGEARKKLLEVLNKEYVFAFETLDLFFQNATFTSDVVLFSPGFPSFDQYQNYQARGKHFKELVYDEIN